LPILLPANPLTINDVADVADFPDLSSISCVLPLRGNLMFLPPYFCLSPSDGSFYTASEAAKDQNQQYVATCCRCVATRKAQRNPCKTRLVAVLPISRTSIYQSGVSWAFNPKGAIQLLCFL
jgi:hypothetical protein